MYLTVLWACLHITDAGHVTIASLSTKAELLWPFCCPVKNGGRFVSVQPLVASGMLQHTAIIVFHSRSARPPRLPTLIASLILNFERRRKY
jgi:hypothetical protein